MSVSPCSPVFLRGYWDKLLPILHGHQEEGFNEPATCVGECRNLAKWDAIDGQGVFWGV